MKYIPLPLTMWLLFEGNFQKQLTDTLGYGRPEARYIARIAKKEYRKLVERLPTFEPEDRFAMNIVSCAMLASFVLHMPKLPDVEKLSQYYEKAMMTLPMKLFCQIMGKAKFTVKDIEGMKKTAALNAADRNPYSWNMDFLPYPDGSGYEARFYTCGICTLMKELGLFELVPAMCHLDYAMSEAGGASTFVRSFTLAKHGPYCDCGYKKKRRNT